MKKTIILLASILFLSSCNYSLKLNKVTMKEYFSHIRKSGSYEVGQIIGNKAILKHYADTIYINPLYDTVKVGTVLNIKLIEGY